MLDFCCTHHVSAVEIGTGNWSNAPHIDLEALVTSNSARIKWHDEIRRRGLSLCALNCSGNPLAYTRDWQDTEKTIQLAEYLGGGRPHRRRSRLGSRRRVVPHSRQGGPQRTQSIRAQRHVGHKTDRLFPRPVLELCGCRGRPQPAMVDRIFLCCPHVWLQW